MNELEKLREENKALKLLLEMKNAHIDLLNKLHEASGFSQGGYVRKEGEYLYGGVVMPAELKTLAININEDGTISKTEE